MTQPAEQDVTTHHVAQGTTPDQLQVDERAAAAVAAAAAAAAAAINRGGGATTGVEGCCVRGPGQHVNVQSMHQHPRQLCRDLASDLLWHALASNTQWSAST